MVVGQTPEGRNVITTIIELKYLDPYYAADLLAALGYGGSVIPVGPAPLMGSPRTAGRSQNPRQTNRNQRGNDNGYGGYQEANRRSQQYPGYQSPYDYN